MKNPKAGMNPDYMKKQDKDEDSMKNKVRRRKENTTDYQQRRKLHNKYKSDNNFDKIGMYKPNKNYPGTDPRRHLSVPKQKRTGTIRAKQKRQRQR